MHERPDDLQLPAGAAGQRPRREPEYVVDPEHARHLFDPLAVLAQHQAEQRSPRVEAVQNGMNPDVLLCGQVQVQVQGRTLEHDADRPAHLRLFGGQADARNPDPPAVIAKVVVRMETVVVLPAPFGPSRQKSCPSGTSELTPSTALVSAAGTS